MATSLQVALFGAAVALVSGWQRRQRRRSHGDDASADGISGGSAIDASGAAPHCSCCAIGRADAGAVRGLHFDDAEFTCGFVPRSSPVYRDPESLAHASELTRRDKELISRCYALRDTYPPPIQSNFNVIAVISGVAPDGSVFTITGCNNETCNIGGSLCAERSAMSKLRLRPWKALTSVHIVTDSPDPVTPGMLCREYLAEFAADTLRVVVHASKSCLVTTLGDLLPMRPLYTGVVRDDVVAHALDFSSRAESLSTLPAVRVAELQGVDGTALLNQVLEATRGDAKDYLFPIRLAAGFLFSDGTTECAWQDKALEYGSTMDPVSKLMLEVERHRARGAEPVLLLMADQFGVLHAPFARARSLLFENDFDELVVVAHDVHGKLQRHTLAELVPACPKLDEVWADAPARPEATV